jgi:UDP-glucose:glycoprotein glucosyltransferase
MLILLFAPSLAAGSTFSFSVSAPWSDLPYFDHILLFLGPINNKLALDVMHCVAQSFDQIDDRPFLFSIVTSLLPPDAAALLDAEYEIRAHLPRIQMFRELALSINSTSADLIVAGDAPTFECNHTPTDAIIYGFDLQFNQSKTIVYANLHDETTFRFVMSLAGAGFVLRPISSCGGNSTRLRGFGVEVKQQVTNCDFERNTSSTFFEPENMDGQASWLKEKVGRIERIDARTLRNMDARFVTFLRHYPDVPLPEIMKDVANNWPIFTRIISELDPDTESASEDLVKSERVFAINGRHVNHPDIFSFFEILAEESNLRRLFLEKLNLSDDLFRSAVPSEPSYLLDYRSENVIWLNDLETDAKYLGWSSDIRDLTQPRQQLIQVRKNLANVVFYCDPTQPEALFSLFRMKALLDQGLAIRIGLVPYFSLSQPLSRRMAFAFHSLPGSAAVDWLLNGFLYHGINKDAKTLNNITESQWASQFSRIPSRKIEWNAINRLYSPASPVFQKVRKTHEYLRKTGVKLGTAMLNGRPLVGTTDVQGILFQVQAVLLALGRAAMAKGITELSRIDPLEGQLVLSSVDDEFVAKARGIGLAKMSTEMQSYFIDVASDINWSGNGESLWVYFGPGSKVFNLFMSEISAKFAVNPTKLRDFLGVPDNETILIVNGRIYPRVAIDRAKLQSINRWSTDFFSNYTRRHGIETDVGRFVSRCLIVDWAESGVVRSGLPDELFEGSKVVTFESASRELVGVEVAMNPFSSEFERIAGLLFYLDKRRIARLRLVLLPTASITDGLDSYYRSTFESDYATFDLDEDASAFESAIISPSTWVLDVVNTTFQLDSFHSQGRAEVAEFNLTNLMATGSCFVSNRQLPDGVDFVLRDRSEKVVAKSVALVGGGHWELRANPGEFTLDTGFCSSRYSLSPASAVILIHTFATRDLTVVLHAISDSKSEFRAGPIKTLNVFSVVTGSDSEELLRVTILSICNHTTTPLKFWLFEDLPSPRLKGFFASASQKLGFEYEFVFYNWRRTDPQLRKFLFMDCVLPLDVNRVIYIEPGFVVRSDLNELNQVDLNGKLYGFVPFCETGDRFAEHRFWNSSFWTLFLKGRKFFSSAIFVVDLPRFRQANAGEYLRLIHRELSSKPLSVGHVDDDLLNLFQERSPAAELPADWNWCDVWCAEEGIEGAKAVGICSNPISQQRDTEWVAKNLPEWRKWREMADEM